MQIVTTSQFPVGALRWRLGAAWHVTVIAKVTFALRPVRSSFATGAQRPLVAGADGPDHVPRKAKPEVVVVGGRENGADMRLRLGTVDKASGSCGPLPNAARASRLRGLPAPIGNELLLPADFDFAWFNTAPADQWLTAPAKPIEKLVLENLLPNVDRFETEVGGIRPRAVVMVPGGTRVLVLEPDTWVIDANAGTCSVTFRAATPLDGAGEVTRIVVTHDESTGVDLGARPEPSAAERTLAGPSSVRTPALPFAKDAKPLALAPILENLPEPMVRSQPPPGSAPSSPPPPAFVRAAPVVSAAAASDDAARKQSGRAKTAAIARAPREVAPSEPSPSELEIALELLWAEEDLAARLEPTAVKTAPRNGAAAAGKGAPVASPVQRALRAKPAAGSDLTEALQSFLLRGDAAPVVLLEGVLTPQLSAMAALKALVELAGTLDGFDTNGRAVQERCARVTACSTVPRSTIESHSAALYDLVRRASRDAKEVDGSIRRVLVEARALEERSVFGDKHAVLHLAIERGASSIPCYLPVQHVAKLPLSEQLRARVLVEPRPRQDELESSAIALRVVAVGRVHDGRATR